MLMMWVWLAVSVTLCSVSADSDQFTVLGPGEPIVSSAGASVVLPCTFSPVFSAEKLEVRWYRPGGLNPPILFYKDQKIQESPVDPQYRDRVSLIGSLEEGNVSLKLENITLSDRGEYECYVKSGFWFETAKTSLTVKVLGSVPVLSYTETGGEQVNVTCVSDGWSPQPTVTWRHREGREMKLKSAVRFSTNSDDLVSVSSWLLFSPSESEWISCSVSLSDQEKRESRVMPYKIPVDSSGPWRGAFIITLILLLLIFIIPCIHYLQKKGFIPHKKSNRNPETPAEQKSFLPVSPTVSPTPDRTDSETHTEKSQIQGPVSPTVSPPPDRTDSENHTEKSQIHIPDWKDVSEKKEDLTLNDKTAAQCLKVTDDKKRVTFTGSSTENNKYKQPPHVLCEQNFSSGKHYWEVKLYDEELFSGQKESWYVGVARDNAERLQKTSLTPVYGYWVLHYERDKGLYVNPDPRTEVCVAEKCGSVLGVFIDRDENTVSFYDVDAESHLYTFSNVVCMFPLVPVISPGVKDSNPLTLC